MQTLKVNSKIAYKITSRGCQSISKETDALEPKLRNKKKMRVLVAIDNSEESFNALKWILDYFLRQPSHTTEEEKEPSTKLSLVHVMEPFPQYAYPGTHGLYSLSSNPRLAILISRK